MQYRALGRWGSDHRLREEFRKGKFRLDGIDFNDYEVVSLCLYRFKYTDRVAHLSLLSAR